MLTMTLTKVIRDNIPLRPAEDGPSIAELIEAQLVHAAMSGAEVQDVRVGFEPGTDEWFAFAQEQRERLRNDDALRERVERIVSGDQGRNELAKPRAAKGR